jgi:hypothetical protein
MRRQIWLLAMLGLCAVGPVEAQTFLTFHCRDGSEFVAAFYQGDNRAHVQLDGKAMALSRRLALRGQRYGKGNVTLRIGKAGVILKRGRRATECLAE